MQRGYIDELLLAYDDSTNPKSRGYWVSYFNKDLTKKPSIMSGGIDMNGVWKIHVSVDPQKMIEAIKIFHDLFTNPATPKASVKFQSLKNLLDDHQSGKEFAIIFAKECEDSFEERVAIIIFLKKLAMEFKRAGIEPENKPVLTIDTIESVRNLGSTIDKRNLESSKYDSALKYDEGDKAHYYHYRAELALVDEETYSETIDKEKEKIITKKMIDESPAKYKHNPKKKEDWLSGVVLGKILNLPGQADLALDIINHISTLRKNTSFTFTNTKSNKIKFLNQCLTVLVNAGEPLKWDEKLIGVLELNKPDLNVLDGRTGELLFNHIPFQGLSSDFRNYLPTLRPSIENDWQGLDKKARLELFMKYYKYTLEDTQQKKI